MSRFLIARAGQSLLLLLLVSVIGFTVLHLAPGGPLAQFSRIPGMTEEDIARIATQLGLDQPVPVQYGAWISRLLTGDWGHSLRDGRPVLSVIAVHILPTLELMASSMLLAIILGTWLGVLAAVKSYSVTDYVMTIGSMIALSIPTFWFGLVIIYVFSVKLDWLPAGNMFTIGDGSFLDYLHHLIAPCIVLALVSVASWSRYMRSAMLDVIKQDYVRTARAKGLGERRVILHHALRNAALPMITIAGLELPMLLSGALVTETVFTWPGMGRLFLDSLNYRDYPVVMGLLMFSAVLVLLGSLLADILYAQCDPRIRLE